MDDIKIYVNEVTNWDLFFIFLAQDPWQDFVIKAIKFLFKMDIENIGQLTDCLLVTEKYDASSWFKLSLL
jgi:hypothetical protein